MVLVSFKIIHIWLSYGQKIAHMPFLGIRVLAITQPLLGQLGWNLLWELRRLFFIEWWWESQETMFILIFAFLGHFWRENGRESPLGPYINLNCNFIKEGSTWFKKIWKIIWHFKIRVFYGCNVPFIKILNPQIRMSRFKTVFYLIKNTHL